MTKNDEEGFLQAKARRKTGQRGKSAEVKVHEFLSGLKNEDLNFDFDRLIDARSCGRPVPPSVADFVGAFTSRSFAIEVKETKHPYRLSVSAFPQFPRMKRRAMAGALCIVVVKHTEEKLWRVIKVCDLDDRATGSWDLRAWPTYGTFEIKLREGLRTWS